MAVETVGGDQVFDADRAHVITLEAVAAERAFADETGNMLAHLVTALLRERRRT